MGRPVRIRQDVAVRVEGLASVEKRSFANMVEVLLLGALDGEEERPLPYPSKSDGNQMVPDAWERTVLTERGEVLRGNESDAGVSAPLAPPADLPRSVSVVRAHMKKDRPAVQCGTRVAAGVCPDCGTIV